MMLKNNVISGLLLGLSVSLGTQILTWLGLGLTNWFVLLTYILVLGFVIITLRKQWIIQNDSLPFTKVLFGVFIIVLVSRYVFQLYMFLYINYVDPNWMNDVTIYWTQMLEDQGSPPEEIKASIDAFHKSYQPTRMFTVEIILYGFPQFILGMLGSLYFVFRKPSKNTMK
jgi:hypothetical protein